MKKTMLICVAVLCTAILPAQAAVTRIELAGAWYGERGTDGRLAAIIDGAYVQTHLGRVELPRVNGLPDLPLGLRHTPTGEFKMCGQSHRGAGTWEWAHGEWHIAGPSYGVNACIYDYAGRLHIGAVQFGSQGFRWANRDNTIVLGDNTYADPSRRLWEWTEQGPLAIGQGEGGCKVIAGADHRLIEPGHCTFVRYTREGTLNSVYMVKLLERKAVVLEFNDTDLNAFPFETIIPPPPPPPPPLPPPPAQMPDVSATIENHPWRTILGEPKGSGRSLDRAYNAFRFLARVARDLRQLQPTVGWGVEKKPGGDFHIEVNGQGYAGDILRTPTLGNDVINGREDETAAPGWGAPGPAAVDGERGFALPPSDEAIVAEMRRRGLIVAGDPVTPEPDPDPEPSDLAFRVAGLENQVATLRTQFEQVQQSSARLIAALEARIHALEQRAAGVQEQRVQQLIDQALAGLTVQGNTGRTYGHGHLINLPVVRR